MGAQESKNSNSKDYIAATYGTTAVLVRRIESVHYASLLGILHKHFPATPTESMIIQTKELPICNGRYVDIPEELWVEVSPHVRNINVVVRAPHGAGASVVNSAFNADQHPTRDAQELKSSDYIVATYEKATVLVRRLDAVYYDNLLSILHKHFPAIPKASMVFRTNELPTCKGRYIDIPDHMWMEVSPCVRNIKVVARAPRGAESWDGKSYYPPYN